MDALLATLATPRPTERHITHQIRMSFYANSISVWCSCGWSAESAGRDESSRQAAYEYIETHEGNTK